jgi:hypothetical protein
VSATTADDVDISSITPIQSGDRRVPLGVEMMKEVAEDVTGLQVPRSGHSIREEQPAGLTAAIVELARRPSRILEPARR